MKLVYCHNRATKTVQKMDGTSTQIDPRGGTTVAMEAIQSWLLDTFEQGHSIVRKVGIARCSEDDNYCRKTGRELAQSRMKTTELTVVNIVKIGPSVTVFLEDDNENLFELKKTSDPYCARLVRMLDE